MSPENDFFEEIKQYLPKYLTPGKLEDLYSELKKFPENKSFYYNRNDTQSQILQGDGWRGFIAINFYTGERKKVSGVVLSNSCDISHFNLRHFPVNLLFSPLIELRKYISKLGEIGKTEEQIHDIIGNIQRQKVNSIFHLPECPGVIGESIILLDDIHTHPLEDFLKQSPEFLFTLNMYAFYLFLIKLSIHFTRFSEGIQRSADGI